LGNSFRCLWYHLVFSTKNRAPQITPALQQRLYDYIGGIIKDDNGQLLAAGGTADHVHLLASIHPSVSVSDMLRKVKASSSKWIHETFPEHRGFAWQEGYGAFSVSQSNVEQVRRYIEQQEEHHRHISFDEEFIEFLERHGVPYDERYV